MQAQSAPSGPGTRGAQAHIFPVSAFLQPYTSPNPPRPMILCTLKSFMVNCETSTKPEREVA